jgi:hypothetical protein
MGTKRREKARSKTKPGRTRPGGRISRSRLEKIPIPPVPAFLQSATRAPEKKQDPGNDPLPDAISPNAISDEEADLLLGVTSSVESDRSRPANEESPIPATPGTGAPELPEGALTEDEADELLGLVTGPAVVSPDSSSEPSRPVAPARSGASGAAVLNELVDEIEKDLERDLDRHAPTVQPRRYGHTIGCWVSPLADGSDLHPPEAVKKKQEGTR